MDVCMPKGASFALCDKQQQNDWNENIIHVIKHV